jgi:ABC-type Fe3+/spermidine/putrescine transport system ATPase subunit
MFQDYVLFPHRNVFDNVAFGLKMQHLTPELITDRVHEVLSLVGMEQSDKRDVNTLSGGEQQRVALARSLAPKPRLLMLDEPLGALDRTLRERLVSDLRAILRQSQQTAIYVTHDQEEAFTVADRVVVMNRGKIIQIGTPIDIFNNPANPFVARFLGMNNLISGVVLQQYGKTLLDTKIGTFSLSHSPSPGKVIVLLRPDRVSLSQEKECNFSAIVKERIFRGSSWKLSVWVNELKLDFEVPAGEDVPNIGEPICLSFEPDHAFQFYKENENP